MERPKETAVASDQETLLTRPMILLAFIAFTTVFGFQLLLSVVPLYADEAGGGSSGAGFATAAFMFSTVFAQIQMPRVLDRFGYRVVLAVGLLFLGLPAFFYAATQALVSILAVTLLRGVGFGIATVVFVALMVELAPPGRRGEALGLLGVTIALPAIFCTALGLWLIERFGYGTVFLLGAITPLLGIAAIFGLCVFPPPRREGAEITAGFFASLGRGPLLRIFLIFAATTTATGVIVTFLPLAVTPGTGCSPRPARSSSWGSPPPPVGGGRGVSAIATIRASSLPRGSSPLRSG
ncbi:MAG: MFS transporter [Actinobacteria bacterium]|nr:MFS transporter [Actinomycetota bacterium]